MLLLLTMPKKNTNNRILLPLLGLVAVLLLIVITLIPISGNLKISLSGLEPGDPFLFQCKCVYNEGRTTWPQTLTIKLHDWDYAPELSEKQKICTQDCRNVTEDAKAAGLL